MKVNSESLFPSFLLVQSISIFSPLRTAVEIEGGETFLESILSVRRWFTPISFLRRGKMGEG